MAWKQQLMRVCAGPNAYFQHTKCCTEPPLQLCDINVPLQVFHWQMCSDPQTDSHRFMDVIETAISAKTVKRYAAFTAWAELTAAKPRPKANTRKAKKLRDDTALAVQIRWALVEHAVCCTSGKVGCCFDCQVKHEYLHTAVHTDAGTEVPARWTVFWRR